MLAYLINISITWLVLYVIYQAILAKEKHFRLNRIYLLSSIVLGLLMPLLSYVSIEGVDALPTITQELNQSYQKQLIVINDYSNVVERSSPIASKSSTISLSTLLGVIYLIGLFIACFRLMKSAIRLKALFRRGRIVKYETHTEVVVPKEILPFSFMQYVFLGDEVYSVDERSNILKHELYHIKAYHSLDILFIELLKVLFWWHPMVYLYKQTIIQNHEYAADEYVLNNASRKQYCTLLMKKTFPNVNLELTNPFFQNYVNKRITMMYQSNSKKESLIKYVAGVFAVLLIAFAFIKPLEAQKIEEVSMNSFAVTEEFNKRVPVTDPSPDTAISISEIKHVNTEESRESIFTDTDDITVDCPKNEKGVYYNLSVLSRLPNCPEGVDERDHAYTVLSDFANEHFRWPAEAIEEGFHSRVAFNFAVNKDGKIGEYLPYSKKKPYPYGVQEEGQRIIDLMREEYVFIPGECNGEPVKSNQFFTMALIVPEDKKHLIKVKDSNNVIPKQRPLIRSVSNYRGTMTLHYTSNMNVSTSFELLDPHGKVIFTDEIENIYGLYEENVQLPNKVNGTYIFRATQDGLTRETKMTVDLF